MVVWTWGSGTQLCRRNSNRGLLFPPKKDGTGTGTGNDSDGKNGDNANANNDDGGESKVGDGGLEVSGDIRIEISLSRTIAYSFFIWLNTGYDICNSSFTHSLIHSFYDMHFLKYFLMMNRFITRRDTLFMEEEIDGYSDISKIASSSKQPALTPTPSSTLTPVSSNNSNN